MNQALKFDLVNLHGQRRILAAEMRLQASQPHAPNATHGKDAQRTQYTQDLH